MAGKGWVKGMMRSGRYSYREVEVHTTNPDHLEPTTPSPTNVPALEVAPRYRRDAPASN